MRSCEPTVTVIIPTFNRERYVVRAVNSVLAQTYKDYEVVVVDDGSTDNTRAVLEQYGNRIRYVYQRNAGVSSARNTGIELTQSEWLAFLDSDDEWEPDYLATQMEYVSGRASLCMQSTDAYVIGLDHRRKTYFEINRSCAESKSRNYLVIEKPFCFVVQHGPWQLGATIIRRKAIVQAGGFDTSLNLSEDYDLMARIALQGGFAMIRKALVNVYRRSEATACLSGRSLSDPIRSRESNERIYQKLRSISTLTSQQRTAMNRVISANRRAIGNLLLEQGDVNGARESYAKAIAIHASWRSLGKYAVFLASRGIRAFGGFIARNSWT